MGLIGWFRRKFNIGRIKLSIVEVETITSEEGWLSGKLALSTKEAVIGQLTYRLICETTTVSGNEKKKSSTTISEMRVLLGVALDDNESTVEDFSFSYSLKNWFEERRGILGAASKALSFVKDVMNDEKRSEEFFVEISAQITGVWSDPSDKHPVTIAIAE